MSETHTLLLAINCTDMTKCETHTWNDMSKYETIPKNKNQQPEKKLNYDNSNMLIKWMLIVIYKDPKSLTILSQQEIWL